MKPFLRLLKYARPYLKRLIAAILCMLIYSQLSIFSLAMVVPLIDRVFGLQEVSYHQGTSSLRGSEGTLLRGENSKRSLGEIKNKLKLAIENYLHRHSRSSILKLICISVILIFLLKGLFSYAQSYLMAYVGQRIVVDLRHELYRHLQVLSLDYFAGKRTGALMSRITYDVTQIQEAISKGLADLITQTVYIFLVSLFLFLIHWKLALLSMVGLPFIMWPIYKIGQKLHRVSIRAQEKMADLTTVLQETLSGIRLIRAFALEDYEIDKFDRENRGYYSAVMRSTKAISLSVPLVEFMGAVGAVLVLWYGGSEVLKGTISPGLFVYYVGALLSLLSPINKVTRLNNTFQQALAAAKRVFDILDTPPTIKEVPEARELPPLKKEIRFHRVSFSYGEGKRVLSNINLIVKAGEKIALVGPSGAGKSTLVDLIPRFYDPQDGYIEIDGCDIRKVKLSSLRNQMGIVSQETILFHDTVRNNIAFGKLDASEEELIAAAKAANAHDFIMAMPQGYDTVIGERGVKLSGGERQRIAIARALLKDPTILILDEATSALDTESELLVQEALERLMKDRTTFIIAHRLSTIRRADKIVVIDKGKILEAGVHKELLVKGGLYKKLYEMQFRE